MRILAFNEETTKEFSSLKEVAECFGFSFYKARSAYKKGECLGGWFLDRPLQEKAEGLAKAPVPVIAWNKESGEIKEFPSKSSAERFFGLLPNNLSHHLDKSLSPWKGWYFFRKEVVTWGNFEETFKRKGEKICFRARHIKLFSETEVLRFSACEKAAKFLGVPQYKVREYSRNGKKIGGFSIAFCKGERTTKR